MFLNFIQDSKGEKDGGGSIHEYTEEGKSFLWILQKGTVKERNGWSQGKLEGYELEPWSSSRLHGPLQEWWLHSDCPQRELWSWAAFVKCGSPGKDTHAQASIQRADLLTHSIVLSHPHVPFLPPVCWDNPMWNVKRYFWFMVVNLSFHLKYDSSALKGNKSNTILFLYKLLSYGWL